MRAAPGCMSHTTVLDPLPHPSLRRPPSWVTDQSGQRAAELWTSGVKDYVRHAEGLLSEFKDVLGGCVLLQS
jgi:hypothetical protein